MTGPGATIGNVPHQYLVVADDSESALNQVPSNASRVYVSGVTNDANDFIVLPAGVPGQTIRGWSVAAHEVRTLAASGGLINGVDSDGTNEAAIAATTMWEAEYINSTYGWILRAWTELGADVAAIVPDNI